MGRRKKKKGGDGGGVPAWMVTYGDLMSLLLTFFVMLVSMSSIQESKFRQAMGSLLGALGVMTFDSSPIKMENMNQKGKYEEEIERIREEFNEFQSYIDEEGLEEAVELIETDEGMLIRMENPVLFATGKAAMSSEGDAVLMKLAFALTEFDSEIRVEGHTDDIPITTPEFPSNWELSAARAVSVLRFLSGHGVPGSNLTATGKGEYYPLVENDTEEQRGQNRRVEIFVDYKDKLKMNELRGFPLLEEDNG